MNRKFLIFSFFYHHPQLNSYIIFLFFCFLTRITFCSSQNPGFVVCHPQTCGNNQNISYPFYIRGKQEPYCGYPGFELLCSNNGFPILNLSNNHYIIQEISYESSSLRVSHTAFSASNSIGCLPPPNNLTLAGNIFQFAPNQKDVFLIYGCDTKTVSLQEHEVRCTEANETGTVVALYKEDRNLSYALENCGGEVVAATVEEEGEDIGEALRRGFLLNWTAPDCSECNRSGGKCGFDYSFYTFQCYCPDRPHFKQCATHPPAPAPVPPVAEKTVGALKLGLGSAAGVAGVALLLIVACYFRRKLSLARFFYFFKKESSTHQKIEDFLKYQVCHSTRRYNYSEIKKMTNSLRDKLGKGGYGSVYKGKLADGRLVAVKLLSESKGNGEEFINEVASISKTSHVNIVSLLGFCLQGSKRALIYEFMTNGSLEKFIYKSNISSVDHQLNCKTLYNVAIGVARGLEYLHRGCNTRILHFDIKPHNILLNEDFCPKISDFGLAKICPPKESIVSLLGARGTIGYIAPEVISRNFGGVSHKSDVYSYGMMVLEMIGGRKNVNVQVECISEIYFPHWIYKHLELKEDFELHYIKDEDDKEIVRKMAIVSLWCIQTNPSTRPTMSEVVQMLEGGLNSLHMPPKPYLTSPSTSAHCST